MVVRNSIYASWILIIVGIISMVIGIIERNMYLFSNGLIGVLYAMDKLESIKKDELIKKQSEVIRRLLAE